MVDIRKWIDERNISIKSKNTKRKRLVYNIDQISGDVSIYYKDIKIGYRQGDRLIWIQKAIRYIVDKIVYPDNFNPYQISNNKKVVNEYKYDDGRLMIENGVLDSDRLRDIIRLDNKCAANGCSRVGSKFLVSIYYDGSIHVDLYSDDNTLMTIDHIIPKSKGGANSIDNYQMMCQPHNNDKGNIYENLNFPKSKLIYRDMVNKKFESMDISIEDASSAKEGVIKRLDEYKNYIVYNFNNIDSIDVEMMVKDFVKKFGEDVVTYFNIEAFLRKINQILQLTSKKNNKHLLAKRDIKSEFNQYYISLDNRIKMLDPHNKSDHFDEIEGEGSVISRKQYEREKFALQIELLKMQEWIQRTKSKVCIVCEGRDAAGKGSTIKRFIEYLNPKGFRVVALGMPTEEEKNNWFARYDKYMPRPGEIVFFDRSWHNRSIVEPAMGYCSEEQYREFMENVNDWEESLVEDQNIILIKLWFSITKEKQLQRFELRQKSPLKYWKFSPNDAKVISKWDAIGNYKNQMFEKNSTEVAPWVVINSNDKKIGRLNAMRYVLSTVPYSDKNESICQYYPEVVNVLK